LGFDPCSQRSHPKGASPRDHRSGDRNGADGARNEPINKRRFDPELIESEPVEVSERRTASSEVIEIDTEARVPQMRRNRRVGFGIHHKDGLRNLDVYPHQIHIVSDE
jgi:hypothetical protein